MLDLTDTMNGFTTSFRMEPLSSTETRLGLEADRKWLVTEGKLEESVHTPGQLDTVKAIRCFSKSK